MPFKIFEITFIGFLSIHAIHLVFVGIVSRRIFLEAGGLGFNGKLFLNKKGKGKPVLFLHGLCGSWRYWKRGLANIPPSYEYFCPDLLGFGRSPKPFGRYTLEEHIDSLKPFIDSENREWTMVGHSMGAVIALGLLQRYPQKIRKIILIGLPYYPSRKIAEIEFSRSSLFNSLIVSRSPIAVLTCYLKDFFALPFFAFFAKIPIDIYRDFWKHTWNSVSSSLFNTILAVDVRQVLEDIGPDNRKKILLIHGSEDSTSVAKYVRDLAKTFPEVHYKEFEGTHQIYLEKPDVVNSLIFVE